MIPDAAPTSEPPCVPSIPKVASRLRWWIHLILLIGFPVALGILGADRSLLQGPALGHTVKGLLLTCALQLLLFAAILALALVASHASRDDLLLRWRGGLLPIPLSFAYSILLRLGLGVLALLATAFLVLTGLIRPEDLQKVVHANQPDVAALVDLTALSHNPGYYWLNLTMVSFGLAGLREELWRSAVLAGFRALWPNAFGSRGGEILAVSIAAVVFGLGHLSQGPIAAVGAGLLGVGLGIVMVAHRSIWPAVLAHGFFDATTFAVLPALARFLK